MVVILIPPTDPQRELLRVVWLIIGHAKHEFQINLVRQETQMGKVLGVPWHVKLGQLLWKGEMSYRIKRLVLQWPSVLARLAATPQVTGSRPTFGVCSEISFLSRYGLRHRET